jgi:hypothetical protein
MANLALLLGYAGYAGYAGKTGWIFCVYWLASVAMVTGSPAYAGWQIWLAVKIIL